MKLPGRLVALVILVLICLSGYSLAETNNTVSGQRGSSRALEVSVSPTRVIVGDTVRINVETKVNAPLKAEILIPDEGVSSLKLTRVRGRVYESQFVISSRDPQGLYAIQAWTGKQTGPNAIGKATFLFRKLVGDFCITNIFDPKNPENDMNKYIRQMKGFGANFLIATSFITPKTVYYKSEVCNTSNSSSVEQGYLGDLLKVADENGISVMLSGTWDATRDLPYTDRLKSTEEIIRELYNLYGSHPSLVGFYVDQEGSGLYYVPYLRKFCRYVRGINPGLLTACSPYVNNVQLASYLSDIKSLDVIIYQGMTMASYRPDNRLKFPLRRVKDFGSISTGAKQLQNKIALTHVETFGFGKESLKNLFITGYNNIYQQILSAATVPDNDGIIMYDYSGSIYNILRQYPQYKRQFVHSRDAVFDGMRAFEMIGKASKGWNQLAVYYPYTDWMDYRWQRYYYNALDGFRMMGIPVDVLPYAPPYKESYLPYWPFHENRHVLRRLLKEKEVLVLPSVSGFQATDSDLMKEFIRDGGTVIAFGPRIPMGRTYSRTVIFGMDKTGKSATHDRVIAANIFARKTRSRWKLGKVSLPLWQSTGAKVVARFEDGSPAIAINSYGQGTAVSVMTSVKTAARYFPALIRDVLDKLGVRRCVDIIGTNENCDVAVSKTKTGFIAAVVNHNDKNLQVTLRPLTKTSQGQTQKWMDLASNKEIANQKDNRPLVVKVKARSYRLIEMTGGSGR